MSPITPHWVQPSHPDVQDVVKASATEFLTKSFSKVSLPPFAVFSKMSFPPCTIVEKPTYATVQCGKNRHLDLNSDMLYINHSCDPSLIFDTGNFNILVGPKGLKPGDELTFFYPSTEWSMAQPFDCFCGTPVCRGVINGAGNMPKSALEGVWLNGHIRELLEEKGQAESKSANGSTTTAVNGSENDPTTLALRDALKHAEQVVEAARAALRSYTDPSSTGGSNAAGAFGTLNGEAKGDAVLNGGVGFEAEAASRRGPTSRELAGEMGGDTVKTTAAA